MGNINDPAQYKASSAAVRQEQLEASLKQDVIQEYSYPFGYLVVSRILQLQEKDREQRLKGDIGLERTESQTEEGRLSQ